MNNIDLPVGFAMALAQNPGAMEKFSALTDAQKQRIVDRTHSVGSRREMHQLVADLGNET